MSENVSDREREVTNNISARKVMQVTWGSTWEMTETSEPVLGRPSVYRNEVVDIAYKLSVGGEEQERNLVSAALKWR